MPTGNLPASGKALFEKVYNEALKGSCKGDKGCAAGSAWKAVHNAGWSKDANGQWHKKANLEEFSFTIVKASFDKATQEMRWVATASDTGADSYNDSMTPELFQSFLSRIEKNEPAPDPFKSDFWQGGMPYISISHYSDLNGKGVPGDVKQVYVDGKYLKAKGIYKDTPLGRACFKAINNDLYNPERSTAQDKVRISIAFLDWKHQHKSNNFVFERKSLDDMCPECLIELIRGEYPGKLYLDGQLVHLAHTRVPVNKRTDITPDMEVDRAMTTRKDDAASIVGEELADELETETKVVGKSEAVVIKAEEEEKAQIGGNGATMFPPSDLTPGGNTNDANMKECVDKKTGKVDEECMKKQREKHMKKSDAVDAVVEEAMTKGESWGEEPASSYLIVGDPEHPTTWHLPYKKHGKIDRGLAGAAKAALTSNHRGKAYGGPDKEKAISKLKGIYDKNGWDWNVKSEAELDADFEDTVLAELAELKSANAPKPHVLDAVFATFKADFDDVMQMNDIDPEGRLRLIQESFNKVGTTISDTIRNTAQPEVVEQTNVVKELSELLKPVFQRLDMIDTQLKAQTTVHVQSEAPAIPQRRNIAPSLQMQQQAQTGVTPSTKKSETPNLRALIDKLT